MKIPATCTEKGWTTYTATFTETWAAIQTKDVQNIPAKGHSYNAVVTAPLCTDKGYTTHTCSKCGDSYIDNEVPATGVHYVTMVHGAYQCPTCGGADSSNVAFIGQYGDNDFWKLKNGVLTIYPAESVTNANHDESWIFDSIGTYSSWYSVYESFEFNYHVELPELHTVIIEPGITHIMDETFSYASIITEVIIPDTVVSIGNYAFAWCQNLITVHIPDSVTTIGEGAFQGCDKLTSITIPKSVESIATNSIAVDAFWYCDSLASIWVDKENIHYSSDEAGVLYNKDKSVLMLLPPAFEGEYIIPDGVTEIANHAIGGASAGCSNVTKIVIPASVTRIGYGMFYGCDNLETVVYCGTEEQWNSIVVETEYIAQVQYHMYGDWDVVTSPSCQESGLKQRVCKYCNNIDVQDIPAINHDWADATYDFAEDGSSCTATRVCKNDAKHVETATATITSAVKTPATCTVDGWTTYTATFSEDWAAIQTKDVQDIPATDHKWNSDVAYDWNKDGVKWTCTATRTCANSTDCTLTETVTAENAEKTPATCTEKGWNTYTATFTEAWATTQTQDVQDIPAKGHTPGEIVVENAENPNCTIDGSHDNVVYCVIEDCKAEISRVTVVDPATGHTEVIDEAVAPTCTETGLTEGKHCSVCNEVLVAQETVDALGHKYVDNVCSVCGECGGFTVNFKGNTLENVFTIDKQVITVTYPIACRVGYMDNGSYVDLLATENGTNTYSFTVPTYVTEVILVVAGDINGDGILNYKDKDSYEDVILASFTGQNSGLEAWQIFAADINGDKAIDLVDVILFARSMVQNHPTITTLPITWRDVVVANY